MVILNSRIANQLEDARNNFATCRQICDFLMENNTAPISAEIVMRGHARTVHIPSEKCGLFTTPFIHNTMLDIRRSLDFFGLKCMDGKIQPFKPRDNDYWMGSVNLSSVSPDELDEIFIRTCGISAFESLEEILTYSNKQLAHFTTSKFKEDNRMLLHLRNCSIVFFEAIELFIYDRLEIPPRPLRISVDP